MSNIYVIQRHSTPNTGSTLQIGDLATFKLLCYKICNSDHKRYENTLKEPLTFTLKIIAYHDRKDRNYTLPYQLDGAITEPLLLPATTDDPILRTITPAYRLVFRYNPSTGLGCLVHIGIDLTPYDNPLAAVCWQSAVNLENQNPTV